MQRFVLNRVDLRDRIDADYASEELNAARWLGGESRWLANVPLVYQALSAPMAGREFVQAPASGEDFFESNRFAYWGSLLHLLTVHLGWRFPALGLRWWIDEGRPTDDERFALIEQTWFGDGQFDGFSSWLWAAPGMAFGPETHVPRREPAEPLAETEWLEVVAKSFEERGLRTAHDLHLQAHFGWMLLESNAINAVDSGGSTLIIAEDGSPRGVIIADDLSGWYRSLHEVDEVNTPHASGRSWRIDVVVKPVGWIGTFRCSRETGRWFAGPHNLHIVGN
jgi:hypothetical protein